MAEITSMRLPKAATTYNVSTDHIVEKLRESGFVVENKPTTKLLPEMVAVLDKAFGSDKAIKQQADSTKLDKAKPETIEMKADVVATPKKKEEEDFQ